MNLKGELVLMDTKSYDDESKDNLGEVKFTYVRDYSQLETLRMKPNFDITEQDIEELNLERIPTIDGQLPENKEPYEKGGRHYREQETVCKVISELIETYEKDNKSKASKVIFKSTNFEKESCKAESYEEISHSLVLRDIEDTLIDFNKFFNPILDGENISVYFDLKGVLQVKVDFKWGYKLYSIHILTLDDVKSYTGDTQEIWYMALPKNKLVLKDNLGG